MREKTLTRSLAADMGKESSNFLHLHEFAAGGPKPKRLINGGGGDERSVVPKPDGLGHRRIPLGEEILKLIRLEEIRNRLCSDKSLHSHPCEQTFFPFTFFTIISLSDGSAPTNQRQAQIARAITQIESLAIFTDLDLLMENTQRQRKASSFRMGLMQTHNKELRILRVVGKPTIFELNPTFDRTEQILNMNSKGRRNLYPSRQPPLASEVVDEHRRNVQLVNIATPRQGTTLSGIGSIWDWHTGSKGVNELLTVSITKYGKVKTEGQPFSANDVHVVPVANRGVTTGDGSPDHDDHTSRRRVRELEFFRAQLEFD
ncbi:oxidoreductase [Striga asiatica]|uniref:Oxidoreductase n=1 Tax=Striga asiatica TaxID=4170 RepID=A0A5A7PIU2_STRAF|nr:oxidoreductase [Striga asiatica]